MTSHQWKFIDEFTYDESGIIIGDLSVYECTRCGLIVYTPERVDPSNYPRSEHADCDLTMIRLIHEL